ncbi:MAG: hypothetical protein ACI8V2_002546 [Candidatus Latescibacterota bacterium]|jgi:hypothetical protein
MNINSTTSSISALRGLGGQLDITSNVPAAPSRVQPIRTPENLPQVGTIGGVLNEEENLAIATLFQTARPNMYTGQGATQRQVTPAVRGIHLDVSA